jgi:hypothetical protein
VEYPLNPVIRMAGVLNIAHSALVAKKMLHIEAQSPAV